MASYGSVPGAQVILPDLFTKPRFYPIIPRRYEDTKPALTQSFTHERILDLGNAIHRKTIEQCCEEKELAIKEAEEAVWEKAEIEKRNALEAALKKATAEHEKALRKLHKSHERAIREEALRVEGEMQKLAINQVKAEREAGEARLRAAVTECDRHWQQKLDQAVTKARHEERQIAAEQAAKQAEDANRKLEMALKSAAEEKAEALHQLEEKKDEEREGAVATAHKKEQEKAKDKLEQQRNIFEQQVTVLHSHISEAKQAAEDTGRTLTEVNAEKALIEAELMETRNEFQQFIRLVTPFKNSFPADFVLPPLRSTGVPAENIRLFP